MWIAGREGGEMNQATAVIGPDFTAEDTGAAIVEVDAAVGILDVDNTALRLSNQWQKTK